MMIVNGKKLMLALSSIVMISVMNGSMFNVSIPAIAEYYGLSPSQVSWVVTAYAMVFAIGAVTYGKLADLYPVRRLIVIGLSLLSLGSVAGFLAGNYPMVIAARVVQAVGGAAIPALAMIVATRYFPMGERGKVLGFIASTVALGSGIGPIVGGFVTQFLGWRYLFLFSVIGLLAIPSLRKYLPLEEKRKGTFDILGAILFGAAVAFILLFINRLNPVYLFAGGVLFLLFAKQINRVNEPFIQMSLLRNRGYRVLLLVGFLVFGVMLSTFFVIPIMLKHINGLTPGAVGLVLFPGAMTAALLGTMMGKWADKAGSQFVVKSAVLLMFLGFLSLSTLAGQKPWVIAFTLVIPYVGFAGIQSALAKYVSVTLEARETGVGMGLYNLCTFISGAVATAFAGFFLELDNLGGWNPLNQIVQTQYENVFLLMAGMLVVSYALLGYAAREISAGEIRDYVVE